MERPACGLAKAIRWPAARAAAHRGKASAPHGARRFDERRVQEGRKAGMALPRPDPKGPWTARGAGSRGPAPNGGSQGLEGEVAGPLGGQRFLGWITSRSTTPCLMRRRGRSTRRGARSRSRSWVRGVNRGPPGTRPTPEPRGWRVPSQEGGRVSGHGRATSCEARRSAAATGQGWVARGCELARRVRSWMRTPKGRACSGAVPGDSSRTQIHEEPKPGRWTGCSKGNPGVRPTRSRTSSGYSISRVGCRVRGDASLRVGGRVPASGPSRERWSNADEGARLDGRGVAVPAGQRVAAK
jgi:hypothetical protein